MLSDYAKFRSTERYLCLLLVLYSFVKMEFNGSPRSVLRKEGSIPRYLFGTLGSLSLPSSRTLHRFGSTACASAPRIRSGSGRSDPDLGPAVAVSHWESWSVLLLDDNRPLPCTSAVPRESTPVSAQHIANLEGIIPDCIIPSAK